MLFDGWQIDQPAPPVAALPPPERMSTYIVAVIVCRRRAGQDDKGGRNARTSGATAEAHAQSVAHHRHREPWRHARLLRFLPHRLCARLHSRLVEADIW